MLSINTNNAASRSANSLNETNLLLQRSMERLSSGRRIVNSYDDAGGLAVSMKMSAAIRRTDAASTNLANAQSFLKTQDGAFKTVDKVLARMSEIATLAQDVTKTTADIGNYQTEFAALQQQITDLAGSKFNGVDLFSSGTAGGSLTIFTNEDSTSSMNITAANMLSGNISASVASTVSIGSTTGATAAIATINNAIQELATQRAQNGSEASRVNFAQEMLQTNRVNLEAANSRIMDVDVASETTQLARFNILQQAGIAMLGQANQSAMSVLRLLN